MDAFYELKDMLCKELEDLVQKGELSAGALDAVDKLTHSIKSLVTIIAMEEGGYSNDGSYDGYNGGGNGGMNGGSYNSYRGYSGRRGRDSMGRYTSGRRYSRDEAKDEVMRHLEKAMNGASGEQRKIIQEAVEELKNL